MLAMKKMTMHGMILSWPCQSIEFENYTKGVKRLPKDTPDYITDI